MDFICFFSSEFRGVKQNDFFVKINYHARHKIKFNCHVEYAIFVGKIVLLIVTIFTAFSLNVINYLLERRVKKYLRIILK